MCGFTARHKRFCSFVIIHFIGFTTAKVGISFWRDGHKSNGPNKKEQPEKRLPFVAFIK